MASVPPHPVRAQPIFYYDFGSAACYLVAERISSSLPAVAEWEAVMGSTAGLLDTEPDRRLIERLARERGLQPLRWPPHWPPDTRAAMLAATYAKQLGRAVAFSLAAFRQAFAGGRDLGDLDTVLIAAAACEMHPAAVLKAIALRSVEHALERATRAALDVGVRSLPAIQVGVELFEGDAGIEQAARVLRSSKQERAASSAARDGEL